MRLESFRIKNFKSIVDTGECHLSGDGILVLAGQNEAGKSAVIEALDFFDDGASENFEKLHRRRDTSPEVLCKFILDSDDIENVFIETDNAKLKKYLQKNPIIGFVRGSIEGDNFDEVFFSEDTRNSLRAFFPEDTSVDDGESETQSSEAVNNEVATSEIRDEEGKSLIPTLDKLEEFLWAETRNFTFYNVFEDLLPGEVIVADLEKYPAIEDFEKVFNVNFTEIVKLDPKAISRREQKLRKAASDNLNTYWKQRLDEGGEYNFDVKILPQADISASRIEFKIDRNDEDPLYVEQKSKGFRWFSAFNLRLRALGAEETEIKNLVILIDEPGQGLHEKAQRDVKIVLEELAQRGAQIIYTTHHPNLIGIEGGEFARLRVVSNNKERGTKVETIAQFSSRVKECAKEALSPVITAMGIHSAHALLDTKRLNVVVEGISDHYYFSAFQRLLDKDKRLYFLPACGVTNVPNLVSILLGWGCGYRAVFDDDAKSGRLTYERLKKEFFEKDEEFIQEHILKISGCNGIEDLFSKRDFFKYVLSKPYPRSGAPEKNSQLTGGKKELLARLFLEQAEKGMVKLSKESEKRINNVFDWLYSKFKISKPNK